MLAPKDSALWGIQVIRINENQFSDFSKRIDEEIKNKQLYVIRRSLTQYVLANHMKIFRGLDHQTKVFLKYNLNTGDFTQYNKNREAVSDIVTNNDVYYVFEDSKGIVWFSTPNGLGKLDPKTDKIKYFTEDDGLPTNLVGSVQEDNYGNLWISSAAALDNTRSK